MLEEFYGAYLNYLFPQELREAKDEDFVNLRQGRIRVKEYSLKFH